VHLIHLVSLALLAGSADPAERGASPRVRPLERTVHPRQWGAGPQLHVDLPYFDGERRLRWDGGLVSAAGACTPASIPGAVPPDARCERRTLLRAPRVDECRCLVAAPAQARSAVLYVGLDDAMHETWRRLQQPFGPTRRTLVGAHGTGLVFDDGEVWSPSSGETVRPGTRALRLSRSCWLPASDAFLEVDADVTLVRTRGGIFLRTGDGERTLVLPVQRHLVGHWVVEDLEPVAGTSLVLLGERFEIRGPGAVRFTVYDLAARKVLFRSVSDPNHLIGSVRVLAGTDGHVGFAYLDESAAEWVLHHLRIE
jgi:hypothetical protein